MTEKELLEAANQLSDVETDSRQRKTFCFDLYGLQSFADSIAARERKECAALCERISPSDSYTLDFASGIVVGSKVCAIAIKERTK